MVSFDRCSGRIELSFLAGNLGPALLEGLFGSSKLIVEPLDLELSLSQL